MCYTAAQPVPPAKPGSMAGSLEGAPALGAAAAVPGTLAAPGLFGAPDAAVAPAAAGAMDDILRQLQDKYSLWQQRLDAHVAQVHQCFHDFLPWCHFQCCIGVCLWLSV